MLNVCDALLWHGSEGHRPSPAHRTMDCSLWALRFLDALIERQKSMQNDPESRRLLLLSFCCMHCMGMCDSRQKGCRVHVWKYEITILCCCVTKSVPCLCTWQVTLLLLLAVDFFNLEHRERLIFKLLLAGPGPEINFCGEYEAAIESILSGCCRCCAQCIALNHGIATGHQLLLEAARIGWALRKRSNDINNHWQTLSKQCNYAISLPYIISYIQLISRS